MGCLFVWLVWIQPGGPVGEGGRRGAAREVEKRNQGCGPTRELCPAEGGGICSAALYSCIAEAPPSPEAHPQAHGAAAGRAGAENDGVRLAAAQQRLVLADLLFFVDSCVCNHVFVCVCEGGLWAWCGKQSRHASAQQAQNSTYTARWRPQEQHSARRMAAAATVRTVSTATVASGALPARTPLTQKRCSRLEDLRAIASDAGSPSSDARPQSGALGGRVLSTAQGSSTAAFCARQNERLMLRWFFVGKDGVVRMCCCVAAGGHWPRRRRRWPPSSALHSQAPPPPLTTKQQQETPAEKKNAPAPRCQTRCWPRPSAASSCRWARASRPRTTQSG